MFIHPFAYHKPCWKSLILFSHTQTLYITRMKRPVIKRIHFKQPFFLYKELKYTVFHSMRIWWKAPSVLHFLCSHKMGKKRFKARFSIDFFLLFVPRAILSAAFPKCILCALIFFPAMLARGSKTLWKNLFNHNFILMTL